MGLTHLGSLQLQDATGTGSAILDANGVKLVGVQAVAEADPGAITDYTAHASGGVTVTSNGATDLDSTAAALATLEDEVTALRVTVVSLLGKLRTHGIIAT